jgi:hypothetical protein
MKKYKQFKRLMKEAENDLLFLQKEASALKAKVAAGAGTEAELKSLKKQWLKKEQLLRLLASRGSVTYRKKIHILRVTLKSRIKRYNQEAAKTPPIIFCTSKTLPLDDVLKDVKFRRASFNRWLSNSPYSLLQDVLILHKQSFKLLRDIDVLVKKVNKISKLRQAVKGFKKAIDDTDKFIESNQTFISYWNSILTSTWEALMPHCPEACENVMNSRDVKSVLNSLNTQNNALKAHEETLNNDADIESDRGSYQGNFENQVINVPEVIPALQNASMDNEDDIDTILKATIVAFFNSNSDEVPVLTENLGSTENNSSYEGDVFITSSEKETEIQKAAGVCNYGKDTQFRANAREALLPFAAYVDGPSTACPNTADNSTIKWKQTCTCHAKGCNLPEEHASVDDKDVVIHYSVQDACDHSMDPWSWTYEPLSFEEWAKMN